MEMRLGQPRPTLLYPQFPSVSILQGAPTEEGCLSPSWSAMGKARFYIFFLKNPTLSSFIRPIYAQCGQLMEAQLFIWGPPEVREAATPLEGRLLLPYGSLLNSQA